MNRIPMMASTDRSETWASVLMGIAVILALGSFFSSLVRVSGDAPQIARALERWRLGVVEEMVVAAPTNAPGPKSRAASPPGSGAPSLMESSRPVVGGPRPGIEG